MGALPKELVIRFLSLASTTPAEQLRLLPDTFHAAVMHAAFPTIDADRSVCIKPSDLEYAPFAEALWPALSHITSFCMPQKEIRIDALSHITSFRMP